MEGGWGDKRERREDEVETRQCRGKWERGKRSVAHGSR